MFTQIRTQLLGKPDKRLLGKAKDNWEQLCKGPKSQTNKVANKQLSNRPNDRLKTIEQPKAKWIDNRKPLTDQAIKDKQFIQVQSDRDKASDSSKSGWIRTNLTKEWLIEYKNKYKYCQRFRVGQSSGSGARGLKLAKGQEPTAKALKIQEIDVGR